MGLGATALKEARGREEEGGKEGMGEKVLISVPYELCAKPCAVPFTDMISLKPPLQPVEFTIRRRREF